MSVNLRAPTMYAWNAQLIGAGWEPLFRGNDSYFPYFLPFCFARHVLGGSPPAPGTASLRRSRPSWQRPSPDAGNGILWNPTSNDSSPAPPSLR